MYAILIADDDRDILNSLTSFFKDKGYYVMEAETAQRAIALATTTTFDAIILDVMLGTETGLDVCRAVRKKTSVPIIFLSALSSETDRIDGFLAGGDDYVAKPFSSTELELRLKRRIEAYEEKKVFKVYEYGGLVVDTGKRIASYNGNIIVLTTVEFDILTLLVSHPEQAFSYDMLYDSVWNTPSLKDRHTIQVHIARLRQKLKEVTGQKEFIRTVSRHGYAFMPEGNTEQ